MDNKIDQLKTEVNEIKDSLNALKNNVSLSESEKKTQAEALKSQAEATKHKIENEITSLESKTDDESKKKKEEAETLLSSFNATMSLYESIINTKSTNVPTVTSQPENENKGAFGKAKDWVGEQWDDVWDKEKWEKEGGKNLLRTAGFVATGVGAIALTVKGIKRLFGKDKKKEKDLDSKESKDKKEEKKPWWKKFLIGTGIAAGTVFGGVELYKNWNTISSWVKEKLGLALNFNEALTTVENEVKNGKVNTKDFGTFCAHFEGMSYNETTQEICSFGEKTKINKNNKTIEGLNGVKFASREELFHAVNIVNFAKRELAGRGATDSPFTVNSISGDIDFNISGGGNDGFISANGSDFWTKTLGIAGAGTAGLIGGYVAGVKGGLVGTAGGGLAGYALGSIVDNTSAMGRACNTIAKGANLSRFVGYLNDLNIREGKQQEKESDEISPIHPYLNKVIDEISDARGARENRDLRAEYDENNPSEVLIKSYHEEVKIKLEGNLAKTGENIDFSKITKISMLRYAEDKDEKCDLDIDFPHNENGLKEVIRVANLTNMLRGRFKKAGHVQYPFGYGRFSTPMGFDIANEKKIDVGGLMSVNVSGVHGTILLEHSTLKEKYPTIYKDLKKSLGFLGLPTLGSQFSTDSNQDKQHMQALQDSKEGSQYIKYLNQMGGGEYRGKNIK